MIQTPNLHDLSAAAAIPPTHFQRTEADLSSFLARVEPIINALRREGGTTLLRFAYALARYEGFDGHARAVSAIRSKLLGES